MDGFTSRRVEYSRPRLGKTLAEKFSANTSETLTRSSRASLASGKLRSRVMPFLPVLTELYAALRS